MAQDPDPDPDPDLDLDMLVESLREAPVVDLDGYRYFVHPVTDCIPLVEPALLREIAAGLSAVVDLDAVDKILTAEAMGIHHATALSLATDVPFVAARKRSYGFDDELAVHQTTGYDEGELYVNFVEPGDRLLLLDDVLSTGGTVRALHDAARELGAVPAAAAVVIRRLAADPFPLPMPVTSLVDVELTDEGVEVVASGRTVGPDDGSA